MASAPIASRSLPAPCSGRPGQRLRACPEAPCAGTSCAAPRCPPPRPGRSASTSSSPRSVRTARTFRSTPSSRGCPSRRRGGRSAAGRTRSSPLPPPPRSAIDVSRHLAGLRIRPRRPTYSSLNISPPSLGHGSTRTGRRDLPPRCVAGRGKRCNLLQMKRLWISGGGGGGGGVKRGRSAHAAHLNDRLYGSSVSEGIGGSGRRAPRVLFAGEALEGWQGHGILYPLRKIPTRFHEKGGQDTRNRKSKTPHIYEI